MQVLLKVFISILQSVFISIIMFLIAYSVITQEFPPNFSKISTTWKGIRELSNSGLKSSHIKSLSPSDNSTEEDVRQLESINEERRRISNNFFSKSEGDNNPEGEFSEKEIRSLKMEILYLKNRVSDLEEKFENSKLLNNSERKKSPH